MTDAVQGMVSPTPPEFPPEAIAAMRAQVEEANAAEGFSPLLPGKEEARTTEETEPSFFAGGLLPPPPLVPVDAFPPEVRALIMEAADAFAVPPQIPAAVLLALASCLVGRSRAVEAKRGWREHGNLWIVLVAPSGLGKTPVTNAFFRPVEELEYRRFQEWKAAFDAYTRDMMDFNRNRREERGPAPESPRRIQYYLDDSTVEALADALSQNPRGVMWRVDELSGLLASFDRYSSSGKEGGTRARLLSAHDCQSWKSNRRDAGRNLHIPAACVSIFGGLQPGMLSRCFDGADKDCGFLPRFLFIRAEQERPALWSEATLSPASEILLRRLVEGLAGLAMNRTEEGQHIPFVSPLTSEAKTLFIRWYNAQAVEGWTALSDGAAGALPQKLKGHALRLCLLLHCLDAALAGGDALTPIPADTMRRALLLADWVKAHQVQAWSLFAGEAAARAGSPVEQAVMAAVVEEAEQIEADGWRISNARLTELVNQRLPVAVDARAIGKAAANMGLPTCLIGEKRLRGKIVSPEKLETFKRNVSHVSHVSKPCGIRPERGRHDDDHMSQTSHSQTPGRDIRDVGDHYDLTPQTIDTHGFETCETFETCTFTGGAQ